MLDGNVGRVELSTPILNCQGVTFRISTVSTRSIKKQKKKFPIKRKLFHCLKEIHERLARSIGYQSCVRVLRNQMVTGLILQKNNKNNRRSSCIRWPIGLHQPTMRSSTFMAMAQAHRRPPGPPPIHDFAKKKQSTAAQVMLCSRADAANNNITREYSDEAQLVSSRHCRRPHTQ